MPKCPRRVFGNHCRKTGAAAVELAVAIPVLLLLLIGVAEFGRIHFASITVANAARAGAQYGAQSTVTSSDIAGMNQAARDEAANIGSITTTAGSFCACNDGSAPTGGCSGTCAGYGQAPIFVTDTVRLNFPFIIKYPGLRSAITLQSVAVFRVQ